MQFFEKTQRVDCAPTAPTKKPHLTLHVPRKSGATADGILASIQAWLREHYEPKQT